MSVLSEIIDLKEAFFIIPSPINSFSFLFFCFVVFNEGEEGMSWYIILKGSVNVVVHGKVRRTKTASLADLTSFFFELIK